MLLPNIVCMLSAAIMLLNFVALHTCAAEIKSTVNLQLQLGKLSHSFILKVAITLSIKKLAMVILYDEDIFFNNVNGNKTRYCK